MEYKFKKMPKEIAVQTVYRVNEDMQSPHQNLYHIDLGDFVLGYRLGSMNKNNPQKQTNSDGGIGCGCLIFILIILSIIAAILG